MVSDWFVSSFVFLRSLKVFWVLVWFVLMLFALGTLVYYLVGLGLLILTHCPVDTLLGLLLQIATLLLLSIF